jgi:hypothetical protein
VSEPALSPTQERTLQLMRRGDEPLVFADEFVEQLTERATVAVAQLTQRLGGEKLWVSKGWLSKVHGCEVRHLAPDDFSWNAATAAGFVAHKAIELSFNWRGEPHPSVVVDEALARLADQADQRGVYVAGLTDGDWAELRSRAIDRTTKFLQDFPPLPVNAHPVLEASSRWEPPGTITFSGKVDLILGRPAGRESRHLIVDFKSGGHSPHHRNDLRFYALIHTLRHRVPPRKLVTYYLDSSTADAEDVTQGALESALTGTLEGIERHVELTVEGRDPVKRVGVACRWCPVSDDCSEGQAFLRGDEPEPEPDAESDVDTG